MDNHYHLMIETPQPNLSRAARQLNGVYTQRFNRRHGRVGHLFQGRFKAILVERDSYLLQLCRYVVLNPVRARMVHRVQDYPWSSYRATAGIEAAAPFLTTDWILSQFNRQKTRSREKYRRFVAEGASSPWPELRGQVLLGKDRFVERLRPALNCRDR
jgi:putative transposase